MVEPISKAMISSLGSHRKDALQWYMLQASSTSAGPPILHGRIRPISGALPKGVVYTTAADNSVAYLGPADNVSIPLLIRLREVNQPAIRTRNRFAILRPRLLAYI